MCVYSSEMTRASLEHICHPLLPVHTQHPLISMSPDGWMRRPSKASRGRLWLERPSRGNGNNAAMPPLPNPSCLRWDGRNFMAATVELCRLSDAVQTKPLKDGWGQKSRTKYMSETRGWKVYVFPEDPHGFCYYVLFYMTSPLCPTQTRPPGGLMLRRSRGGR